LYNKILILLLIVHPVFLKYTRAFKGITIGTLRKQNYEKTFLQKLLLGVNLYNKILILLLIDDPVNLEDPLYSLGITIGTLRKQNYEKAFLQKSLLRVYLCHKILISALFVCSVSLGTLRRLKL
jgi:hypothetical protein